MSEKFVDFDETYFSKYYDDEYTFEYHYPIMKAIANALVKISDLLPALKGEGSWCC